MFLEDENAAHFAALNDENRQYLRFTGTKLIGLDVTFAGVVAITACSIDPSASGNSMQFTSHDTLNTTFRLDYRICEIGASTPFISYDRYRCHFGGAGSSPTTDRLALGSAVYNYYTGSTSCVGTPTTGSVDFELSAIAAKEWFADYFDPGAGTAPDVRLQLQIATSDTALGGLFNFISTRSGRGVSVAPATWLDPPLNTTGAYYTAGVAYDFSSATCEVAPVYL